MLIYCTTKKQVFTMFHDRNVLIMWLICEEKMEKKMYNYL